MSSPRKLLTLVPMETRRRRRTLVATYYALFAALAIGRFWIPGPYPTLSLLLLAVLAGAFLLGGIFVSGPVRPFAQWQTNAYLGAHRPTDPPQTLGLAASPKPPRWKPNRALQPDEHDLQARDRAHYLAYATLRWIAIVVILIAAIALAGEPSAQAIRWLEPLAVPFVILFFSLPQAILLWTEPDLAPDPAPESGNHPAQPTVRPAP